MSQLVESLKGRFSCVADQMISVLLIGFPDETIWQLSGQQGNQWLLGQTTISQNKTYEIVFEGTRDGYNGDIAIDDISSTLATCEG